MAAKVMERIYEQAKKSKGTVVLPESKDERVVRGAVALREQGIASPILVGDEAALESKAKELGLSLEGVEIVNPESSALLEELVTVYQEVRAKEKLTDEQAREVVKNEIVFAALMVRQGKAGCMTSGSMSPTAETLRAAIKCVGLKEGLRTISSCFIMEVPECSYGEDGLFLFGDCAVVPKPRPDQLADVAISTAETARQLLGIEPRVAMLSFSTYGSATHPDVEKVKEATRIAKEKMPELLVDGELQADAAIVEAIGKKKAAGSTLAGRANVLIFPDLNAGNIGYKLVQRLAKAEAIGPIIQGLARPVNDLSRGCSVEDIVGVCAIGALQARK